MFSILIHICSKPCFNIIIPVPQGLFILLIKSTSLSPNSTSYINSPKSSQNNSHPQILIFPYHSLLTINYSLLTIHYSLLTIHYSLLTVSLRSFNSGNKHFYQFSTFFRNTFICVIIYESCIL